MSEKEDAELRAFREAHRLRRVIGCKDAEKANMVWRDKIFGEAAFQWEQRGILLNKYAWRYEFGRPSSPKTPVEWSPVNE